MIKSTPAARRQVTSPPPTLPAMRAATAGIRAGYGAVFTVTRKEDAKAEVRNARGTVRETPRAPEIIARVQERWLQVYLRALVYFVLTTLCCTNKQTNKHTTRCNTWFAQACRRGARGLRARGRRAARGGAAQRGAGDLEARDAAHACAANTATAPFGHE